MTRAIGLIEPHNWFTDKKHVGLKQERIHICARILELYQNHWICVDPVPGPIAVALDEVGSL